MGAPAWTGSPGTDPLVVVSFGQEGHTLREGQLCLMPSTNDKGFAYLSRALDGEPVVGRSGEQVVHPPFPGRAGLWSPGPPPSEIGVLAGPGPCYSLRGHTERSTGGSRGGNGPGSLRLRSREGRSLGPWFSICRSEHLDWTSSKVSFILQGSVRHELCQGPYSRSPWVEFGGAV